MLTNVASSACGVKVQVTSVGAVSPGHLMRISRFGSNPITSTGIVNPYIAQVHWTRACGASRALPLVNQNFDVIAGSTNANNSVAELHRRLYPRVLSFGDRQVVR